MSERENILDEAVKSLESELAHAHKMAETLSIGKRPELWTSLYDGLEYAIDHLRSMKERGAPGGRE